MDKVGIRAALVSRLDSYWPGQYPTAPVLYENIAEPDLDAMVSAFLTCTVIFNHSEQASLGEAPMTRHKGYLGLTVFDKAGNGTRNALEMDDYLTTILSYKNLAGVHTGAPLPGKSGRYQGWYFRELHVPFWADSTA